MENGAGGEPIDSQDETTLPKDKDNIFLKNGNAVQGWLWKQENELIVGRDEEDETFIFEPAECSMIEENILFNYFKELL